MLQGTAQAGVNIALIKYWGKRDAAANLPAVGSISLTLDHPGTRTTVTFDAEASADVFELDGRMREDTRVAGVLDAVRAAAGIKLRARVTSVNTVPTASGLASSASGTAALGVAAWRAAGLPLDPLPPALVELVRRGSGSAPRSLLGGLVELDKEAGDVRPLLAVDAWDLRMVIAVLTRGPKAVSSREGMTRTEQTSPYYAPWVAHHAADLVEARAAIAERDLPRLGAAMERSTYRMHACMLAADPPLRYWRGRTMDVLDAVDGLRAAGTGAWATMDAGPHVKILCAADDAERVADAIRHIEGVHAVWVSRPGAGAVETEGC